MMHGRLARRLIGSVMTGATYGAAALAILPLAVILGMLLLKGAGSLDWNFFTKSAVPVGEPATLLRLRGATLRQLVPVVVDLRLVLAVDDK